MRRIYRKAALAQFVVVLVDFAEGLVYVLQASLQIQPIVHSFTCDAFHYCAGVGVLREEINRILHIRPPLLSFT